MVGFNYELSVPLVGPTTLAAHLRNLPRLPKPPRATLDHQRLIESCHEVSPKDRPVRYSYQLIRLIGRLHVLCIEILSVSQSDTAVAE